MGTRCYVELWADDPVKGNEAIDAVMAEMRRIDDLMSHYKPESQLSQINAARQRRAGAGRQGAVRSHQAVDALLADHRRGLRHHLRERRLPLRLPRHIHPTEEQIQAALPAVNWRNMLFDETHHTRALRAPGHAHRPRRHRQGLRGRPRHRRFSRHAASEHAVVTAGGDSRIIGDHLRPAVAGRDPPSRRSEQGGHAHSAVGQPRCRPRGTTSATSMRTGCAITTSSIRAPVIRRARCAAPPIIGAHRDADRRDVQDRLRARARTRRSRSSIACPSTTRCSCSPTARCCIRTACGRRTARPTGAPPPTAASPRGCLQQRVHFGLGGQPVLGLVAGRKAAPLGAQVRALGDHRAARLRVRAARGTAGGLRGCGTARALAGARTADFGRSRSIGRERRLAIDSSWVKR